MADQQKNELIQTIPEQYNLIGDDCFKNNGKMKEIWLPLGCKVIGREAFYGCHICKKSFYREGLQRSGREHLPGTVIFHGQTFLLLWKSLENSVTKTVII